MAVDTEQFLSGADMSGDCWRWQGSHYVNGYGKYCFELAHRISYRLFKGEIPKGLHLDHLCRVVDCINPDHLEAVTPKVNVLRGVGVTANNAKKTHCVKGHEFTAANTYARRDRVTRECRTCRTDAVKKHLTKKEG